MATSCSSSRIADGLGRTGFGPQPGAGGQVVRDLTEHPAVAASSWPDGRQRRIVGRGPAGDELGPQVNDGHVGLQLLPGVGDEPR